MLTRNCRWSSTWCLKKCCNKTFFLLKYNHCLLLWSWLPLPVSLSGLASLSVLFLGSYLVCHRNCQLAGLVHLCSGLSSPAEMQQLWKPLLSIVSCSSCTSSTTRVLGRHLRAHHSIIPLLLPYVLAPPHYFKAWARTSASFPRQAPNREGPRRVRSAIVFWE